MPTALVTGGAVRLGRAIALHLAQRGHDIALHYGSSKEAVEQTADEAKAKGVRCQTYGADFTDFNSMAPLMDRVLADFTDVELLVNSAANFIQENLQETSGRTLQDTFNINLTAPFVLMREYKRKVGRGLIVNLLDERILRTVPTFGAYSVSKSALAHLTELAAVEWGESVRVNGIAPGLILPPAGESDDYLKRNAPNIPTKTHGDVSDIVRGLDYLIDSPFVNGEILFIDGGESKSRK
ncbi:short-chain dehydrogenase [Candidatus Nitromaritima sp. SCGC AAA799-C22]|nr:short-chain dehydrogenase [Candidatus Nitromaritima sp. SCGC AAA799-C22]